MEIKARRTTTPPSPMDPLRSSPARPLSGLALSALLTASGMLAAGCASTSPPAAPAPPAASAPAVEEAPAAAVEPQPQPEEAEPLPPVPKVEELSDLPLEETEAEPEAEAIVELPPAAAPTESAALLEESLEAFESSEVFWQQGSFEDAFAALDRAYELMASVPSDGDPYIAQQKEDLRHLISKRVVEVYASRQTAVGDLDRSIPVVVNDEVQREIASFQGPERDFFVDAYRRSGFYRPMILEELRRAGLPEQLGWLPLVESGFKVRAFSRARALGLWQFISSTGYRYGLQRSWWIDERMDPLKSTRGAIAYLTDLHNLFGDWMTALAAYNCGEGTVLRQIQNQPVSYFDQFWDLYGRLPRETRRYVPRFLATLAILEDPEGYGFALPEPMEPMAVETVQIERSAELKTLDRALGLEEGTLTALNPELRRGGTPEEPYELRIPAGRGEVLLASLEELPKWQPPAARVTVHRVRRGETLSGVAARYGTSVRALMELNRLRSANRIWPGQQLRVPDGRPSSSYRARALAPGAEVVHRVRSGDSLWRLANQYGTTVDRIKRDNGLKSNLLRPGQRLRIGAAGAPAGGGGTYTVRRGDTLGAIARRHGVSLNRLLSANHLSSRSTIYPGQELTIPD